MHCAALCKQGPEVPAKSLKKDAALMPAFTVGTFILVLEFDRSLERGLERGLERRLRQLGDVERGGDAYSVRSTQLLCLVASPRGRRPLGLCTASLQDRGGSRRWERRLQSARWLSAACVRSIIRTPSGAEAQSDEARRTMLVFVCPEHSVRSTAYCERPTYCASTRHDPHIHAYSVCT